MARTNRKTINTRRTHEGAKAYSINAYQELRRTVMACLLWEDTFYESGVSIADRIAELVPQVSGERVAALANDARNKMNLRHAPLWIARHMAIHHPEWVADTLYNIIQRPDELAEFLSLYWLDGKTPLSNQVKKGLALAFTKFDAYQLAKYNRKDAITLRDVMFLVHPKPRNPEQAQDWKALVEGTLPVPDTWETQLSAGGDKKEVFTWLLENNKLGAMALLRNLRNMRDAGVSKELIRTAILKADFRRVLPFRFFSAAQAVPAYENIIEEGFFKACAQQPKLPGRTLIVVDISGSMYGSTVSGKSIVRRSDVASTLAALAREQFEDVAIYATAGNDYDREHATAEVPARRGFALRDAIFGMERKLGGGGIFLTPVCRWLAEREHNVERMIVITDEQDCAVADADSPTLAEPLGTKANYLINVNAYKNGIGYGKWTHIDGWSNAVIEYMREIEQMGGE